METSKTSTQLSFASLSSVPEDIRASLFPQPDSEEARRTTVTSGLRCSELYKSAGRLGCLQKMLLVTSRWVSTKCFLTWKDKTTPANRLLFQLVPKMPVTDEIESGLWRTPMNCDYKNMTYAKQEYLSDQVKMWPTPTASDSKTHWNDKKRFDSLTAEINREKSEPTGQLNAAWVEALMGYPPGWTSLDDGETDPGRKGSPG